jgi:hypothetical protein
MGVQNMKFPKLSKNGVDFIIYLVLFGIMVSVPEVSNVTNVMIGIMVLVCIGLWHYLLEWIKEGENNGSA